MNGRFIAFEGGEATGKSTQAARLVRRIGALSTREPGGTPAGRAIRDLFLDPATGDLDPRTEALLMAADRAQHVAEVVRPALNNGRHVVTDRYLYSSVAYQGYGRGLGVDWVRGLSLWATVGLQPDAVVLMDLPVDVARARVADVTPDRVEQETKDFHSAVREGFLAQAREDTERWLVIDASAEPDDIESRIWDELAKRLPDLADDHQR